MDLVNVTVESLGTLAGIVAITMITMTFLKPLIFGKDGGAQQDRFAPAVSVIVGLFWAVIGIYVLGFTNRADIVQALINGFVGGLASVGLYGVVKRTLAL